MCDQGINGGEGALGNIFSCVVLVLLSLRSRSTEYWTGTILYSAEESVSRRLPGTVAYSSGVPAGTLGYR